MRVFLSWSGDLSHKVAVALRDWLPAVVQALRPYVSSEDIDKGTRWSTDIAKELEASTYGILCITKANLEAPWINFEAGALSKAIDKSNVTPFLFHMKRSEVQGPLLQFQSTIYEREDVFKLITSINAKLDKQDSLEEVPLKRSFDVWWPQLESVLNAIPTDAPGATKPEKPVPQQAAILEELLDLARNQVKLLRTPEELLPPRYLEHILTRSRVLHRSPDTEEAIALSHRLIIELADKVDSLPSNTSLPQAADLRTLVERLHNCIHDLEPRRRFRHLKPPPSSEG